MESALHALQDAAKVSEGIANLQFHPRPHISYKSHVASEKDMKWIEDRQCTIRRERTMESILEDINHLTKVYAIQEFNPIIQKIQLQYNNLVNQIHLYEEQLKRYQEGTNQLLVEEKKQEILNTFKEEEGIIESEIHSYEQTIETYTAKLHTLQQEESSLRQELESVQTVLTHYNTLKDQNQQLMHAIETTRQHVSDLKEERRRTLDNMLTEEEANELEKQRIALDASEREEAELMVEVETILKSMDSSLSVSVSNMENEKGDVEKQIARMEKRHTILQHVCEEFVNEGKDKSAIARAMQIIIQNGGEIPLNDLKAEMKRTLEGNPSAILSTIYSLVGNQIIRIDRSSKEQKVICMICPVCRKHKKTS